MAPRERPIVGFSTKMYFSLAKTESYAEALRSKLATPYGQSVLSKVDVFIIPDHVTLRGVIRTLKGAEQRPASSSSSTGRRALIGAQNAHWHDSFAATGEVSPLVLAEAGCDLVELNHAERRREFGESDETARRKVAGAVRNGLIPLVCIGELTRPVSGDAASLDRAVGEIEAQVASVLEGARQGSRERRALAQGKKPLADSAEAGEADDSADIVLAYEPVWAIGQKEPADAEHVREFSRRIRDQAAGRDGRVRILYGGSAGPGVFEKIQASDDCGGVDGLFLGRFAHDVEAFWKTIHEVAGLPLPSSS